MKKVIYGIILIVLSCKELTEKEMSVWMIGDSTMANKRENQYPQTGWGSAFGHFFNETVSVQNHARDGYSTGMFIKEGLWGGIQKELQMDDFVLIQFGHNDESIADARSYTPPDQFKLNLIKFIQETRSGKAIPVLITPVARRKFDNMGHAVETHFLYSNVVREVASQYNVPLIDLDKKSMALLDQMGPENSKSLYLILKPGMYANYPQGITDNTHFIEYGAKQIAQIVLTEIKSLSLTLADKIVP